MKLELMNGSELEATASQAKTKFEWPAKDVQCAEAKLFTDNAHFLLENAQRIFQDSRLFLTPVWIQSGMAYVGAFPAPCLGGYLEWWLNAECASKDTEGGRELVYFVSGSPMSGTNVSMAVKPDGTCDRSGGTLSQLARTYIEVMKRYQEHMRSCASYTLEEAINVLKGRQASFEHSTDRIVLEQKVNDLTRENAELKQTIDSHWNMITAYRQALCRAVVREYPDDVRSLVKQAELAHGDGSGLKNLFNAFAKREKIVLTAPSKRFLLDELEKLH